MSTTVQYDGATIGTLSRTTGILNTAGKWADGDIVITDNGMDSDACVYQDQDGFLIFGSTGNARVQVEPLAITTNGTTQVSGKAYTPVTTKVLCDAFLESVIDRSVTEIKTSDLIGVDNIGKYAFYGCTALETVHISSWTGATNTNDNNWIFGYAGDITKTIIVLPSLINFGSRMFSRAHCKIIDIGETAIGTIREDTFYSAQVGGVIVETLILRRPDDISPAITTDAINGVRTVYVPNDLIESYKTATNWSTQYDNGIITFLPIEGSQYENYYADGTPIE